MSASPTNEDRDYTDGASALDIQSAIMDVPRGRGDSQVASSYQPRRSMSSFRDNEDSGGAIFDGPGSMIIPSSQTGLKTARTRSFRAGSRRASRNQGHPSETELSRPNLSRRGTGRSDNGDALADSDVETSSPISERPSRSRHRMSSQTTDILASPGDEATQERRTSMFGNLASFFGGRRETSPSRKSDASRSRRGSIDYAESISEEREDRWGYHSSEEGSSDEDAASLPGSLYPASSRGSHSRPTSPSSAFPGMGRDPIFGDTRIDMDEVSITESIPLSAGPPSQQDVYIADEDLKLRFLGYQLVQWRGYLWSILSVVSLGMLGLVGHWFPEFWLRCVARKKPFGSKSASLVIVEVVFIVSQ